MINSHEMFQTYNLLQRADAWASKSSASSHTPPPRCTFVASAATPTVTMPRIKALMSGVNPSFVDVFRNFDDGVVLKRDNLIQRLHQRGDRLVLLGDDTWLKLFPKEFDAKLSDPTHSFFAQDTSEVDDNVTRHVAEF
jgi:predicted AlkP superfamily pyrophosphatase or phosphodiesterase